MKVRFFDASTAGNPIGSVLTIPSVKLVDGVFSIDLPLSDSERNLLFSAAASPWIEIEDVTHSLKFPRQVFASVPYALKVPVDPNVLTYDANGKLTLSAPPENGKVLGASGGSLAWVSPSSGGIGLNDQGDATALTIDSSERIGIGTTTPTAKLSVNGNIDLNYNAIDFGGLAGDHGYRAFVDTNVLNLQGFGGVGFISNGQKNADLTANGLVFEGEQARGLTTSRRTTANSAGANLVVSAGGATVGATDKGGGDLFLDAGLSTGTGAAKIYFRTPTPQGSTSTTDNALSTKMLIDAAGNVGIGSVTPSAKLDVKGTASLGPNGEWTINSSGHLNWYNLLSLGWPLSQAGGVNYVKIDGGNNHSIRIGSFDDGYVAISPGTGGLKVFGNSSFLGSMAIGLATPDTGYSLHLRTNVGNATSVASTYALIEAGTDGLPDAEAGIWLKPKGNWGSTVEFGRTGGTAGLNFYNHNDSTSAMFIDGTGNVGIGTYTPASKLDVVGDTVRIRTAKTPLTSTAACVQGQIAWDVNYVYVCVATNTWKRSALTGGW